MTDLGIVISDKTYITTYISAIFACIADMLF